MKKQHRTLQAHFRLHPHVHGVLFAAIALMLLVCSPLAAQDVTPHLQLSGDFIGGDFKIGSHLDVGLTHGEPSKVYILRLVDEYEDAVAGTLSVVTDNTGSATSVRLWTRSGVEGCDVGAVHAPASYHFISFEEAKTILDGRVFKVQVFDGEDSGTVLAETDLSMIAVTPYIDGYPSGGSGCLRTKLAVGEPLYLAIAHQAPVLQKFKVYLVEAQDVWLPGDPLVDVRGAPQFMAVPRGANPWVELLWLLPAANAKPYQVIVRRGGTGQEPGYQANVDVIFETGIEIVGLTANECGGVCPPPA